MGWLITLMYYVFSDAYMWWYTCYLCMIDRLLQWFGLCLDQCTWLDAIWCHDWMVYFFAMMAWLMESHSSLTGWSLGWWYYVPDGDLIVLSCMSDDSSSRVLMPWCMDILAWYYMQMLWWLVTIGWWYVLWFFSGFCRDICYAVALMRCDHETLSMAIVWCILWYG